MDIEDYSAIPEHMMRGIRGYIEEGWQLGGFLYAIFTHDLWGAFGKADHINLPLIQTYIHYIHWELPATCHGSKELVEAWIMKIREKNDAKN